MGNVQKGCKDIWALPDAKLDVWEKCEVAWES